MSLGLTRWNARRRRSIRSSWIEWRGKTGALLKLDLEGHEAVALRGAARLLAVVEVVVSEVQFFPISDNGRPVFADMAGLLRGRGFELYDFACLAPRPRDLRLRMGDVVFARRDSSLLADRSWQ